MNITALIAAAGLVIGLSLPAMSSSVFLTGDSSIFTTDADNEVLFRNIFDGKSVLRDSASAQSLSALGTTATETQGSVTSANLVGKDFLMTGFNRTSFSGAELSAISSFVSGGGSLFLFGEGNPTFSAANTAMNTILSTVGSSMSLSTTSNFDNGGLTTFNATTATPFGNGVNTWKTGFTAEINLGSGTAVISGIADTRTFGTAVVYEEVAGPIAAIPVPASLPLLAAAVTALGFIRRRNHAVSRKAEMPPERTATAIPAL